VAKKAKKAKAKKPAAPEYSVEAPSTTEMAILTRALKKHVQALMENSDALNRVAVLIGENKGFLTNTESGETEPMTDEETAEREQIPEEERRPHENP